MEFESFYDGVLLHIGIQEGQSAPVDSLLAIIGKEGEDITALLNGGNATTETNEDKVVEEAKPTSAAVEIPAGVKVVTMPRLSDTMTTGTVATWLKKVGDTVKEGDILLVYVKEHTHLNISKVEQSKFTDYFLMMSKKRLWLKLHHYFRDLA
jgi:pyruvate dehydrogenase E2 component (dihydrolipoamide acetyltransferase)